MVQNYVLSILIEEFFQNGFHESLHSLYNYVIGNINDTRHYVRSEIKESISGIWLEAEPHLQNYLNDMR